MFQIQTIYKIYDILIKFNQNADRFDGLKLRQF